MSNVTRKSRRGTAVAVVALVFGIGIVGAVSGIRELDAQAPGDPARTALQQNKEPLSETAPGASLANREDLPGLLNSVYVDLARSITPGVVQVEVRSPGEASRGSMSEIPEPFRQFFNIPEGGNSPSETPPEQMAGGTGFLISPDGYVLTNAHVVNRADKIVVNLLDRTSHRAELVGADPTTDLAVIKIDGTGFPTLQWGSSRELQVGEPVMAVGNPGFSGSQALDYTVTTGIVSALGRPLSIIRQSLQGDPDLAGYAIENFIQTDAVINPGNSGGPLVDLDGRVIGVNSALASSDGHYQGYGFAIPADLAMKVAGDLMEHGHVLRGWLGVSVTGISSEDAEAYNLPRVGGVLVQDVTEGGPAAKAGVRVEDVVLAVNGIPVQDSGDLQELVAELNPGARAKLELYRDGKPQAISVQLGEVPFASRAEASPAQTEEDSEALLGMTVSDLSPQLASQFGYDDPGGAVVTQVIPWSPAMQKGIVPGMKITEVSHKVVESSQEFRQSMAKLKEGELVTIKLATPDGVNRIVNLRAEG